MPPIAMASMAMMTALVLPSSRTRALAYSGSLTLTSLSRGGDVAFGHAGPEGSGGLARQCHRRKRARCNSGPRDDAGFEKLSSLHGCHLVVV